MYITVFPRFQQYVAITGGHHWRPDVVEPNGTESGWQVVMIYVIM